ncbi:MAG: hypothetical protein Q8Q13_03375 [bacterium]|nr:hypothetical protein [bacterium]
MSKKTFVILACAFVVFASPAGVYAQASGPVQTSGQTAGPALFGGMSEAAAMANCKDVRGALSMSVGQIAAQGGGFVPVSDAAVTRNTGILVYKECVLRSMINAERKHEIAQLVAKTSKSFLTGRKVCTTDDEGVETCETGPMFPENLAVDEKKWADAVVDKAINSAALNSITSAYRDDVKLAVSRNYAQSTQNPGSSLACSNPDPAAVIAINSGSYSGPQDLYTVADPNCNAMGAMFNTQSLVMSGVAADRDLRLTRLGWNSGVYDVTVDTGGISRVVTPGFIIAGTIQQQLGSGFNQLENANDIGQLVDGFFAGIGQQILAAGAGGLMGLIDSQFGQQSYFDRIVSSTGLEVESGQISATVDAVTAAYANETAYSAAKNATASVIRQGIAQMRAAESACWDLIVPPVTAYAQQNGMTLKIATTTTASQAVIDKNMAALANATQADITASNATMTKINQILAGVMNKSTSPTDAYNQVNALVSSGALHTADQAQSAIQQTTTVQTALTGVVADTVKQWGDDPLPNGWCNINNPGVITMWANKWKR